MERSPGDGMHGRAPIGSRRGGVRLVDDDGIPRDVLERSQDFWPLHEVVRGDVDPRKRPRVHVRRPFGGERPQAMPCRQAPPSVRIAPRARAAIARAARRAPARARETTRDDARARAEGVPPGSSCPGRRRPRRVAAWRHRGARPVPARAERAGDGSAPARRRGTTRTGAARGARDRARAASGAAGPRAARDWRLEASGDRTVSAVTGRGRVRPRAVAGPRSRCQA